MVGVGVDLCRQFVMKRHGGVLNVIERSRQSNTGKRSTESLLRSLVRTPKTVPRQTPLPSHGLQAADPIEDDTAPAETLLSQITPIRPAVIPMSQIETVELPESPLPDGQVHEELNPFIRQVPDPTDVPSPQPLVTPSAALARRARPNVPHNVRTPTARAVSQAVRPTPAPPTGSARVLSRITPHRTQLKERLQERQATEEATVRGPLSAKLLECHKALDAERLALADAVTSGRTVPDQLEVVTITREFGIARLACRTTRREPVEVVIPHALSVMLSLDPGAPIMVAGGERARWPGGLGIVGPLVWTTAIGMEQVLDAP